MVEHELEKLIERYRFNAQKRERADARHRELMGQLTASRALVDDACTSEKRVREELLKALGAVWLD